MKQGLTRSFALTAATLLTASGIATGVGVGTAAAAPANTADCATSTSVKFSGYTLNKEVTSGTVAPGGTVTYRTKVTGPGGLVNRIADIHPEGFELVKATEDVRWVVGGQKRADVTSKVTKTASDNTVSHTSSGWTTGGSAYALLETTYRVPASAKPGDVFNSGAAARVIAVDSTTANPINVCVTIREPNAVEAATGSLEGLGLGSLTAGSTAVGDITSDPASFSADLINGIDIGQLIGGAAGS